MGCEPDNHTGYVPRPATTIGSISNRRKRFATKRAASGKPALEYEVTVLLIEKL